MDRKPRVAVARGHRLPGVQAHAHLDLDALGPGVGDKCTLAGDGRQQRVARAGERDEEAVPLRVDLVAPVGLERGAQECLVLVQHRRVLVAQLLHEARRSLDVGEEEGDGALREVRHPARA